MSLMEQMFAHRHDIKKLKLKLHPDKGGTSQDYHDFNVLLNKLKRFHPNWASRILSCADIRDIDLGNVMIVEERRRALILSSKLTLQMIIDFVHEEFSNIETKLQSQEFPTIEILRYAKNDRFTFRVFTNKDFEDTLNIIFLDLVKLKSSLQKSKVFLTHDYLSLDCETNLDNCLDETFDWRNKMQIEGKSISQWFLTPDATTDFNYNLQKHIAKNALEAYLFKQLLQSKTKTFTTPQKTQHKTKTPRKRRHVCNAKCRKQNDKSNKLRKIDVDALSSQKKIYFHLITSYLKDFPGQWISRSEITKSFPASQKKNAACFLTHMYQQRPIFCQINKQSLGLLMRKTANRRIEMRLNI